jgi:translation initiation factor IF-2
LIAHLSTLSELMDLKADSTVPAQGMVIESQMLEGQGVVAQVLVREGTLRPGQCIVSGPGAGRIRALRDDQGRLVKEAGPGTPVAVSGLDELPAAGDRLYQVESLAEAKEIAEEVRAQRWEATLQAGPRPTALEALVRSVGAAEVPQLNVILRADVNGSVEVLKKALGGFPAGKAKLNILHAAVGAISEADVHLAKASDALVIGFHVVAEERARQLAEQLGVEIRLYRIIYEVLDDLHKALTGLVAPEHKEEIRGSVAVREVYHISRVGVVAGCYVSDGIVNRSHRVRLVRDGRVVLDGGEIASLRRFKDDAREVRAGLECGIKLQSFDDVKPGDVIQAYELVEVAQQL